MMNRWKPLALQALISAFIAAAGTSASDDETAIRAALAAYVEAFNNKDLPAIAAMWAENATHTDRETGERTEGGEAIRADIAATFQERPGEQLAGRVNRVHGGIRHARTVFSAIRAELYGRHKEL